MSYSNSYFSKSLSELNFEDIEHFFATEKEESDKIEFKSNGDKESRKDPLDGILRTICGMLNSEGGIIIWGAPLGKEVAGRKEKVFQGTLTAVKEREEKDAFIGRLTDSITPSPRGIWFQPLEKDGKFIYVIEVEQSPYSPHQFKNIYHMRIDGQTRPAPHHYVEALFKKTTHPNLEGFLKIMSVSNSYDTYRIHISAVFLNLSEFQNEHEFFYKIHITNGEFMGYGNYRDDDYMYDDSGTTIKSKKYRPTLFYNENIVIEKYIDLKKSRLKESENKFEIILFFGGKASPLKASVYKLQLQFPLPENLNDLIKHKNENRYSFELVKSKETLRSLIGRDIS